MASIFATSGPPLNFAEFGAPGYHSGVVGRERMGTAFPHKKLRGKGVPTREILRLFCIITIKFLTVNNYVTTFSAPRGSNYIKTGHQNLQSIRNSSIKTNFQGYMLHLYSRRVVSQISSNIRYLNSRTYVLKCLFLIA